MHWVVWMQPYLIIAPLPSSVSQASCERYSGIGRYPAIQRYAEVFLYWGKDHFVNAPSQYETTLHCNIVPHWLGTFTRWSLLGQSDVYLIATVPVKLYDPNPF